VGFVTYGVFGVYNRLKLKSFVNPWPHLRCDGDRSAIVNNSDLLHQLQQKKKSPEFNWFYGAYIVKH
jgi:hypothetical protein